MEVNERIQMSGQNSLSINDINMFIYFDFRVRDLTNDMSVKEILDRKLLNNEKVLLPHKKEISLAENPQAYETIWVTFSTG